MKKKVFWRLVVSTVLTTVAWSAITLDVYGYMNKSDSGGTLLDVFRGRGSNSSSANPVIRQETADNSYSPAANTYSAPYSMRPVPFSPAPAAPAPTPQPQPAVQNKWSIKSWLSGAAPNQPQSQYVEPAPPLTPSYNHPHAHEPQPVMPSVRNPQYPVVPLDSEDFRPQEGAVYNEKGEMIYNPASGEPMPNFAENETIQEGNVDWDVMGNENMPDASIIPPAANPSVVPYKESDSSAKRVIMGRSGAGRASALVNQERVYNQTPSSPSGSVYPAPEPIPAQIPINPFAQQPTKDAGNPPVGSGKSILGESSGSLKLESGSTAFNKTYKPVPRVTNIPTEPVMDMSGPALADVPAQKAPTAEASPIIEDLHSVSPLEKLSEKSDATPALEPVPEPVPEIDVPKEKLGNREQGVGNSDSPSANSTPLATRNSQLATPQTDSRKEKVGSSENTQSVPQTPLATRNSQLATSQAPLIIDITGPEEVEFGKNEMFSLSVINTTDAVRRDIVLSVHPEGFGSDKTASINLERLESGEKKSIYMKLNARQYNNLSLTAQVRDSSGFETTKSINVRVKDESVKISILPPQTGTAFVGQPSQYLVRIVNNAPKIVSLNAVAFFGNGIEPIRASGAPNTIQSGQVIVSKPIELKQGEMRDLKIIAVAFQPGIHKILVQLIDSRGATYAAKESCAYRQREFDDNETETIETDARIELTPGKSEIGVWKPAMKGGNEATIGSGITHSPSGEPDNSQLATPDAPALNAPDAVPLTQPDQGPQGDLIMPMFAQ